MFASTAYDSWKLDSPPEAEEENMYVSCDAEDDDGAVCSFKGTVTAMVDTRRYYWSCPTCDWDHEEEWEE
jgi:hypothetical protein